MAAASTRDSPSRSAIVRDVRKSRRAARTPGPSPSGPRNLGEHLEHRRLEQGLTQRDVELRLGVTEWTVINGETSLREPRITYYPAIVRLLGFDPSGQVPGDGSNVVAIRRSLGISRRELARRIAMDEGTRCDWERGTRRTSRRARARICAFMTSPTEGCARGITRERIYK